MKRNRCKTGGFHLKEMAAFSILWFFALAWTNHSKAQESDLNRFMFTEDMLNLAGDKLNQTMRELNFDPTRHPAHTDRETGKWESFSRNEWTSGFFAGSLWFMYQLTGDTEWRDHARSWTEDMEPMAFRADDHDTGFRIFSSFGNGYKLTGSRYYQRTIHQAALSLSQRFDPNIGAIKSWEPWKELNANFPVIIDNLMNLELLFWAAEDGGVQEWHDIALQHALTSQKHHMRENGSSYHVVDFDPEGNVNWKNTVQGYGPNSTWARGQAWAIYGFTMIYRFTGDEQFLRTAEAAAEYFINNLPEDRVPIYDFSETVPSAKTKDASAAAIAASGLFELYSFTQNPFYFNSAADILNSLSGPEYTTFNSGTSSILKESTLHRSNARRGTSYADYYFLESVIRYHELRGDQTPGLTIETPFYLEQNYPNPFNSSTRILYSTEKEGMVYIGLYDISGKRVYTIENQFRPPGNYRVDLNFSGLSSGTYFYRLLSNGRQLTKKMILIK